MALRSLPLQFNLPHVDARPAARLDDAGFKSTIAAFQASTLGGVMSTAVQSLHDYRDREMAPALQHVQQLLKVASKNDVLSAIGALQQLTLRAGSHTQLALDVLEGFGAVGLHKDAALAPFVRDLLKALAGVTHADDLKFVMEVAAEVPGARAVLDDVGRGLEAGLAQTLNSAQSPRTAAQQGDQKKMMELMEKNRSTDYRALIHDAALWGQWLGPSSPLAGAAYRAHHEMFPAYHYPHAPKHDPVKALFDDGFVRGRG